MFVELQGTYFILKKWKQDPTASKRQIGIRSDWMQEGAGNGHPLSEAEVQRLKEFLRRNAPTSYFEVFTEK